MNILIPIISAILYRLGGTGREDRFLPFLQPPTPIANKWWRWGMGLPIALLTGKWIYILTYFIATNVFVYGENSWAKEYRWVVSGLAFGLASLNWWNGIVCAVLFYGLKKLNLDQAYWEFLVGGLGTIGV